MKFLIGLVGVWQLDKVWKRSHVIGMKGGGLIETQGSGMVGLQFRQVFLFVERKHLDLTSTNRSNIEHRSNMEVI